MDSLVAQHRPAAAAPCLLQAGHLAAEIIETHVHAADEAVFRCLSRGDHGDRPFALLPIRIAFGEVVVQLLGNGIGIGILVEGGLEYLELSLVPIHIDHHAAVRDASQLEGIKTGELDEGTKVTTRIAAVGLLRGGREEHGVALACPGVLSHAAERPSGDDHLVLRVIPFRVFVHRIPEQPQAKPTPTGKPIHKLIGKALRGELVLAIPVAQVHDADFLGIAPGDGLRDIGPLGEKLHFLHIRSGSFQKRSGYCPRISRAPTGHVFAQMPQAMHLKG